MVTERLAAVRRRVDQAASRSGRRPGDVTLIAVSKGHSVEAIRSAYDSGHRDFGENRAQELADKAPHLPGDIRWHFVGSLQRRKARLVRPITWLLHSIDREALVDTWVSGEGPAPPVLVQVNVGRESQKGGVLPEAASDLVRYAFEAGLDVRGLMAIPPIPDVAADSARWFTALADLRDSLAVQHPGLTELSMGMTDDYEVAVEAGSTMIRVGRAIFGPRPVG